MVAENFTFAFPLDQSNCLEVTLKVINKLSITAENTSHPIAPVHDDIVTPFETKTPDLSEVPDQIIQAVKKAHTAFTLRTSRQQSFIVATATGFQLLHLHRIVYFDYQPDKKQWLLWLNDHTQLPLKRNTIAENILNYSPGFIRINQRQIINLDYLDRIDGRSCQLSFHPANGNQLIISRSYLKGLQERVEVI